MTTTSTTPDQALASPLPIALDPDASHDIPNATVIDTGERVTAAWIEDDESDEWARTFECRFAGSGLIDYIAPEELALDPSVSTE